MTVELRAGVGDGRPNHRQDVALVQLLLNAELGGVPIGVDGSFGPATRQALDIFQMAHFGFSDHVVDPGDITFKRLRRAAAMSAADDTLLRVEVLRATGEGASILGSAPSSERPSADGLGTVTTWSEGEVVFIHSHPRCGTWEVRGLIAIEYQSMGEEAGAFGNPISGERDLLPAGGRVSWFERGTIEYRPGQGVVQVPAP